MQNQIDYFCLVAMENSHTDIHRAIQSHKEGDKRACKDSLRQAIEKAVTALANI